MRNIKPLEIFSFSWLETHSLVVLRGFAADCPWQGFQVAREKNNPWPLRTFSSAFLAWRLGKPNSIGNEPETTELNISRYFTFNVINPKTRSSPLLLVY
jgi:hypothetical protein